MVVGIADIPSALPPETTAEQNLKTASQRRVNIIWEVTQAVIALLFVSAYVYAAIVQIDSPGLANATFLIVGFYFSRTNHQRVGGVGGDTAGTR